MESCGDSSRIMQWSSPWGRFRVYSTAGEVAYEHDIEHETRVGGMAQRLAEKSEETKFQISLMLDETTLSAEESLRELYKEKKDVDPTYVKAALCLPVNSRQSQRKAATSVNFQLVKEARKARFA